jgi:plastocyanin
MRKALNLLLVLAFAGCAGASMGTPPGSTTPQSSRTAQIAQERTAATTSGTVWNVGTGASTRAYALQDLDFFPSSMTIDAGDSIAYHLASGVGGDAHTVSFVPKGMPVPPPNDPKNLVPAGGTTVDGSSFVNSGILLGGQTFTLLFTKPGTYTIYCLFHEPAMEMVVTVQATGAKYPHTASYYLHEGDVQLWQGLEAAEKSLSSFPFKNGGTTLAAGIDPGLISFPPPDSTVLRYLDNNNPADLATQGNITIHAGTVLTWMNETSNEPHTVTIVPAGEDDLPNVPPDPAFGGHIFDGSKAINSGTFIGGQSFWAKFTKPGKYFYGCLYHDNSRMTAWVTVLP